jgi:hypothetical protein
MRLRHLVFPLLAPLTVFITPVDAEVGPPNDVAGAVLEGRLSMVWGDPPPGSGQPAHRLFAVTGERGDTIEFTISEALFAAHGGFLDWNGRQVRVHFSARQDPVPEDLPAAQALTLLEGRGDVSPLGGPTGSQPWISILCKFSDKDAEPRDLAYFRGMYANEFGGLDDYWRKQSYGRIDIVGSTAIDWVELPEPQSFYVPDPGSGTGSNRTQLFTDCTAAVDGMVDFSMGGGVGFSGINMMFNDLLDCCAWGGGRFATLDGVNKLWRTTWNPPWSYAQAGIIAHEMGHGFGLPHSNNFDEDTNPYDSPWDVMSAATSNGVNHPEYGRQGKHHTAYHKALLGWFDARKTIEVSVDDFATITLDAMAVATTANYRMATIPIPGTDDWYTVEARKRLGYDANLPGDAVIISYIDTNRSEPAWSVDTDEPPANFANNEGTMFRVGEVFTDPTGQITISIDAETDEGFVVTINGANNLMLFRDRFEQ